MRRRAVSWYGGGRRRVRLTSGVGRRYKAGAGLVPLRWIFVRDDGGTHRDEYFFSTDAAWPTEAVVGAYTGRRNIETTFRELRAPLGLETTRGRRRNTALRAAPCLFGLYSAAALLYPTSPDSKRQGFVCRPGKETVTFSDALTAVRRWLWVEGAFPQVAGGTAIEKLPGPTREILLSALAPAA